MDKTKILKTIGISILILSLPIALILVRQNQDNRSHASPPDQLEAEGGSLIGNATSQNDSNASGGKFIILGINTTGQTPTPTPSQSSYGPRPAPATPTGGNVYTVPSSIDGTGNTEVSSQIQTFVDSVPNGTSYTPNIIVFPSGKTYKIRAGIRLNGRSFLTFFGYGSKLNNIGVASDFGNQSPKASAFIMGYSGGPSPTNIKILGFEIQGANTLAGTHDGSPWRAKAAALGASEAIMGISSYGPTTDLEIADNYIHNEWSDGVFSYCFNEPNYRSDRWNIHHNHIDKVGRQGITHCDGDDWQIKSNWFTDLSGSSVDGEDSRSDTNFSINRLHISDNLIERWGWDMDVAQFISSGGSSGYFTTLGHSYSYTPVQIDPMKDIYIERNTFRGGSMSYGSVDYGRCNTGNAIIGIGFLSLPSVQKYRVYIRDNRIEVPTALQCGSGIRLLQASGGEITGNYMPGMTIGTAGSTGLTIQNNNSAGQPNGGNYPD